MVRRDTAEAFAEERDSAGKAHRLPLIALGIILCLLKPLFAEDSVSVALWTHLALSPIGSARPLESSRVDVSTLSRRGKEKQFFAGGGVSLVRNGNTSSFSIRLDPAGFSLDLSRAVRVYARLSANYRWYRNLEIRNVDNNHMSDALRYSPQVGITAKLAEKAVLTVKVYQTRGAASGFITRRSRTGIAAH
jgi:hypothetical protein